jgi:hypothetical protein
VNYDAAGMNNPRAYKNVPDLFVIGGGAPAEVLGNYQRLTRFPHLSPLLAASTAAWMVA